jgi:hypothetical protein
MSTETENKNCPFCGEKILVIAKKCKHCKEILVAEDVKEPPALSKATPALKSKINESAVTNKESVKIKKMIWIWTYLTWFICLPVIIIAAGVIIFGIIQIQPSNAINRKVQLVSMLLAAIPAISIYLASEKRGGGFPFSSKKKYQKLMGNIEKPKLKHPIKIWIWTSIAGLLGFGVTFGICIGAGEEIPLMLTIFLCGILGLWLTIFTYKASRANNGSAPDWFC